MTANDDLEAFKAQMDERRELVIRIINERDQRYAQRFDAQERATELALARVDKEFHEHIVQVREETKAALTAAEKAITKAEDATEKRFAGVNEFRQTLSDQTNTFVPRAEWALGHASLIEKVDALDKRVTTMESAKAGGREAFSGLGMMLGIVSTLIAIAAAVAAFAR